HEPRAHQVVLEGGGQRAREPGDVAHVRAANLDSHVHGRLPCRRGEASGLSRPVTASAPSPMTAYTEGVSTLGVSAHSGTAPESTKSTTADTPRRSRANADITALGGGAELVNIAVSLGMVGILVHARWLITALPAAALVPAIRPRRGAARYSSSASSRRGVIFCYRAAGWVVALVPAHCGQRSVRPHERHQHSDRLNVHIPATQPRTATPSSAGTAM